MRINLVKFIKATFWTKLSPFKYLSKIRNLAFAIQIVVLITLISSNVVFQKECWKIICIKREPKWKMQKYHNCFCNNYVTYTLQNLDNKSNHLSFNFTFPHFTQVPLLKCYYGVTGKFFKSFSAKGEQNE